MPPLCQPGRGGHELDLIKGLGGPSGLWSAVAPLPSRDGSGGALSSRIVDVEWACTAVTQMSTFTNMMTITIATIRGREEREVH